MATLTKKTTIRDLVAAYARACATIRETYAALNEAQATLDVTFNLDGFIGAKITTRGEYQRKDGFEPEKAIAYLRRAAWRFVVERLEIRRVMSSARIRELDERLEKGALPELTEEAAFDFADEYTRDLDKIFAEQVREVFDHLRPRERTTAARKKTNRADVIGRKVILVRVFEFVGGRIHARNRSEVDLLRSLENIFSTLDGRGQINKHYRSELQDAIESAPSHEGATGYFRFKACGNGNLHLEFLRPDLLAKFNAIAGGANLPKKNAGA